MLVIDGFKGQTQDIIVGLPQGSLVSPILFIIYISGIFGKLESQFPSLRILSFVDDTTFLVPGALI